MSGYEIKPKEHGNLLTSVNADGLQKQPELDPYNSQTLPLYPQMGAQTPPVFVTALNRRDPQYYMPMPWSAYWDAGHPDH